MCTANDPGSHSDSGLVNDLLHNVDLHTVGESDLETIVFKMSYVS